MNAHTRTLPWFAIALAAGCSGSIQRAPGPIEPLTNGPVASPEITPQPAEPVAPAPVETVAPPAAAPGAQEAAVEKPAAAPPPEDTRPRLAAIAPFAYIYRKPDGEGLALGYVRFGSSIPLKSDKPIEGKGCSRGWYAVEPRGYVCLDSHKTTLDLHDPYYLALKSVAPTPDAVWYYHYAFSNGAPMYSRIPTAEEIEKEDRKFGPRGAFTQLAEWSAGHEELLMKEPIAATDPVPEWLAGNKRAVPGGNRDTRHLQWRVIPNGSMVAYARAFEAQGRVWLLTPDLMIVPADRVRQIHRSTFHGVKLEDGVSLPLAWNRTKGPKYRYKRGADGKLTLTHDLIASKTSVQISEDKISADGRVFYPLRDDPTTFVDEADVTISTARKTLPSGVSPGQKWIEAKILPGTLTLYEGDKPVYATLFSPGKGGVPVPGHDNTKYATTQTGYFPIEWKDHVATMSNEKSEPKVLWFTDVPHIQYLRAPLAMHVAYWHEDFGNPKSAECVNVSPEDGHLLFNWTEPGLFEGWGGIRPGGGNGKSTPVIITAR